MATFANPAYANPAQWQQNLGVARAVSARLFRDGCTPSEALVAYGLTADAHATWASVVDRMAAALSGAGARRRAA